MTVPVYLEIQEYRPMLNALDTIKEKLIMTRKLLDEMHDVRAQEANELRSVNEYLEELGDKLERLQEALRIELSDPTYYMGIQDPSELRKQVLETAKLSVDILKSKYHLRELRAQKIATLKLISDNMQEIQDGLKTFSEALPDHDPEKMPAIAKQVQKQAEKREAEQKKTKKKSVKKAAPEPEPTLDDPELDRKIQSNIEKLESRLGEIEGKLNKL